MTTTTYTVKMDTDLAIAWLCDPKGSRVKTSQNIEALRKECEALNEALRDGRG